MKIEYIEYNLLEAPETIIVHGCNSKGVMGSGVAKAIKDKYPQAFKAYKRFIDWRTSDPNRSLPVQTGDLVPVWVSAERMVVNAITQYEYGRDKNKVYVDYDGFRRACVNIRMLCRSTDQNVIAMPFIGAGLANGDWKILAEIIEQELTSNSIGVKIYYLDVKEKEKILGHVDEVR